MVQAQSQPRPQRPPLWQSPLVLGLCFGLGYGITQRLLVIGWPKGATLGQGFEVRSFPGTSLESLRLKFGVDRGQSIRGDLQRQQQEQQSRQEELDRQRQEQRLDQERRQEQERLRRLDAPPLGSEAEPGRGSAVWREPDDGSGPMPPSSRAPSRAGGLVEPPPPPVLPPPPASP